MACSHKHTYYDAHGEKCKDCPVYVKVHRPKPTTKRKGKR